MAPSRTGERSAPVTGNMGHYSFLYSKFGRRLYSLAYKLLLKRVGFGNPVAPRIWDAQYKVGTWDFLSSNEELDHYSTIVAMVRQSGTNLTLLDVGCGYGRLLDLLPVGSFKKYTGVDVSTIAIERARSLQIGNAVFTVGDFQSWSGTDSFDLIIFNESLYYAARPVETARRFSKWLVPGGKLIVSLVEYGNHDVIWRKLGDHFQVCAETTVRNEIGNRWKIKVLALKCT